MWVCILCLILKSKCLRYNNQEKEFEPYKVQTLLRVHFSMLLVNIYHASRKQVFFKFLGTDSEDGVCSTSVLKISII